MKLCPLCNTGKRKRACPLQDAQLICEGCCGEKQSFLCGGCEFYSQASVLSFQCRCCGAREIEDEISEIAQHGHVPLFEIDRIASNNDAIETHESAETIQANQAIEPGESYRIELSFPFRANSDETVFLYSRAGEAQTWMEVEIVRIRSRDHYSAIVEVFVRNTGDFPALADRCPEHRFTLPDLNEIYPGNEVRRERVGEDLYRISSMCQDGGISILVQENAGARIVLVSEGWFNHWRSFACNLRLSE
ncbi:MAG: hypothetical protein NXI24_10540 [bacterium]|nr:hypothetical protein [bacterium]